MKEVREKQRKTPGTHLCLPHVHAKVFAPTHMQTSDHTHIHTNSWMTPHYHPYQEIKPNSCSRVTFSRSSMLTFQVIGSCKFTQNLPCCFCHHFYARAARNVPGPFHTFYLPRKLTFLFLWNATYPRNVTLAFTLAASSLCVLKLRSSPFSPILISLLSCPVSFMYTEWNFVEFNC